MPCCSACAKGSPTCPGSGPPVIDSLSKLLGFSVPGIVVADALGMQATQALVVGAISSVLLSRQYDKNQRIHERLNKLHLQPIPLIAGGFFYFMMRESGQVPSLSIFLAYATAYAVSIYDRQYKTNPQQHSARLANKGQFLHQDQYRQYSRYHSLDEKI